MKVLKGFVFTILVMAMGIKVHAAEWRQPSPMECIENRGEVKHGTLCYVDWESAKSICEKAGARLPSMEEFEIVIEECGWDVERIHKKKVDTDYTLCIERKGFPLQRLYWSSSVYGDDGKEAKMMHFETGVFYSPKSYLKGVVYCVKDE